MKTVGMGVEPKTVDNEETIKLKEQIKGLKAENKKLKAEVKKLSETEPEAKE